MGLAPSSGCPPVVSGLSDLSQRRGVMLASPGAALSGMLPTSRVAGLTGEHPPQTLTALRGGSLLAFFEAGRFVMSETGLIPRNSLELFYTRQITAPPSAPHR